MVWKHIKYPEAFSLVIDTSKISRLAIEVIKVKNIKQQTLRCNGWNTGNHSIRGSTSNLLP